MYFLTLKLTKVVSFRGKHFRQGRGELDWSAVGLSASEDSGAQVPAAAGPKSAAQSEAAK